MDVLLPSDVAAKFAKPLPLILPLAGVLCTGIFVLDLLSPLGRVVWLLYFLPLFLTFWFSHKQYLIPLATVCTALIIVGFIQSSPGIPVETVAFNRSIGVVVLWITTFLLRQHKQAEEALQNAHDQLELRVEGRTSELRRTIDLLKREDAERQRAENAFHTSLQYFQTFMDNSPVVAFMKDEEGRYVYANRTWERIFHKTGDEVMGKTDLELWPPETAKQLRENDQAVFAAGHTIELEEVLPTPGGTPHTWVVFKFPLRGPSERRLLGGVALDITERKRAEEALRKSEERFQLMARATNDVVWDWDLLNDRVWWNEAFQPQFGYSPNEIEPGVESWTRRLHPDDRERVLAGVQAVIESGYPYWSDEYRFRCADGSEAYVFDRGYVIHDDRGKVVRMIGAMMDITERKRAEEERKRLNKEFRLLLQSTGEGIYGIDLQGRCTFINKAASTMLGYHPEELYGKVMHQVHHHSRQDGSPYPAEASPIYNSSRIGQACRVDDEIFWRKDGTWFPTQYSSYPIIDDGVIKGAVVTFTDITERKQAETSLHESEQRLRLALEERERLSQDLHDNIIQRIYAIGMGLEECQHLITEDATVAVKKLRHTIAQLNIVIRDVRNYIVVKEPDRISAVQLRTELTRLAKAINEAHSLRFRINLDPLAANQLTPEETKHVLSIAHEAMSNGLRHSGARTGVVSLQRENETLRLMVEDSGVGFDAQTLKVRGQGLRNIAARAQKLGAHLQVISERGRGTRILVDIPKEQVHAPAGD